MRTASLLAPIMGVFLSACSATAMGPFTVFADPGEYEFHSCEQLAARTGGMVVNVIAYKPITSRLQNSSRC